MKKMMKLTGLALVLLVTLSAGSVLAADADLTVTATVNGTCSISAGTLNFGTLDPTSGSDANAVNASAATVTCTNGTGYAITQASANGFTLVNGGNAIPYALSYTVPGSDTGVGNGTAQNISLTGDIVFADYQTKPAGVYNDTVTLTITP